TTTTYTLPLHDALPIFASTSLEVITGKPTKNPSRFSGVKTSCRLMGINAMRFTSHSTLRISSPPFRESLAEKFRVCRPWRLPLRSEEHTSELQSRENLV